MTDSRPRVLASSLGTTLQKTDRILSGSKTLTVTVNANDEETKNVGEDIILGLGGLNLSAPRDVTVALGLNYHELGHYLFSPRVSSWDMQIIVGGNMVEIATAHNYLEESRVETLFSAMYGKSKYYFTVAFANMAMKSNAKMIGTIGNGGKSRGTAADYERYHALSLHLLAHGRAYLPANIRSALRDAAMDAFPRQSNQDRIVEAEKIIDYYRTMTFEELSESRTEEGVRLKRWQIAAYKLHKLFPEIFNKNNKTGECREEAYGSSANKSAQQQRDDKKKEEEAAERAQQDKSDDYEELDLEDDQDDEDDQDESDEDETDEEGQEGSGDDSGDEEGDDDEGDDQEGSGGSGDDSEDDEETNSGNSDDEDGDQGDEDGSGDGSGSDSSDEGDEDSDAQGVGGGESDSPNTPPTKEERREMLESVIAQIVDNSSISDEIDRIAQDIEAGGEQSGDAAKHTVSRIPVSPETRDAISEISRVFEGLRDQVSPGWLYGTDEGRLNTNRAMMGADFDEMFDQWDEGREDDASVEMVILLDLSTSMEGDRIYSASILTHVLRSALSEVDAHVSVYGFSIDEKHVILKGRDDQEQDSDIPIYDTIHGTEVHSALARASEVFAQSDCANRVLITITDGVWQNDRTGTSIYSAMGSGKDRYSPDATYTRLLNEMDAYKVLCFIDRDDASYDPNFANYIEDLTKLFDTSFDCHTPTELAAPLSEVVANVVQKTVS